MYSGHFPRKPWIHGQRKSTTHDPRSISPDELSPPSPADFSQSPPLRSERRGVQPIFVAISVASRPALPLRALLVPSRAEEIAGEIRKFARYPMNSNRPCNAVPLDRPLAPCPLLRFRANKSQLSTRFSSYVNGTVTVD